MPVTQAGLGALRAIDLLVIHCSATRNGLRLPGPAEVVIDGWHKARGFARQPGPVSRFNPGLGHIGYHFVVDVDGRIATGRGIPEPGAHVQGFNARSIGVCMVGGAEPQGAYTLAQWTSLAALVGRLMSELRIPRVQVLPGHPTGICGHRDLSPDTDGDGQVEQREWLKTCPGFDVWRWVQGGMEPLVGHIVQEGGAA